MSDGLEEFPQDQQEEAHAPSQRFVDEIAAEIEDEDLAGWAQNKGFRTPEAAFEAMRNMERELGRTRAEMQGVLEALESAETVQRSPQLPQGVQPDLSELPPAEFAALVGEAMDEGVMTYREGMARIEAHRQQWMEQEIQARVEPIQNATLRSGLERAAQELEAEYGPELFQEIARSPRVQQMLNLKQYNNPEGMRQVFDAEYGRMSLSHMQRQQAAYQMETLDSSQRGGGAPSPQAGEIIRSRIMSAGGPINDGL